MVETKRTSCLFCSMLCGVEVHAQDGHVVKVRGDQDNPINHGRICPKVLYADEFHHHPDRLNHPLKRAGARGEGKWERITWDQALDEVATKLLAIKAKHGPEAVIGLGGTVHGPSDWSAWRWLNLFGSPNVIWQGRNCGTPEFVTEAAMYGAQTLSRRAEPGVSKLAIIWGFNPYESDHKGWVEFVRARRQGCKIVVVDPVRTRTADDADLHIPIRPGTDGALALAMINVIIAEGLYDRDFVQRWCLGFDELSAFIRPYTPAWASPITWIPEDQIVELARLFATLKPAVLTRGVSLQTMGGDATKSAVMGKAILRAITGNLDVRGGTMLGRLFDDVAWLETVGWAELFDHPDRTRDSVSAPRFPIISVTAMQRFWDAAQRVNGKGFPPSIYLIAASPSCVWPAIHDGKPYPIKAVISQGGNVLLTLGDTRQQHAALTSPNLDLHVAMDYFMTPTCQLADYVLPAADWMERPDLVMGWGLSNVHVASAQVFVPLYERRNDYEFWKELGRRTGQMDRWPDTLESMLDQFLEPSGMTFAGLLAREHPWHVPPPAERHYERVGFGTPSGKVELLPSLFQEFGVDPLPRYGEPPLSPLSLPELAPQYPYILISGARVKNYMGSRYRERGSLRDKRPWPRVQIHPETAAAHGISDGDKVYVETPWGKIWQLAEITERIHPRVVSAEGYWWYPERNDPSSLGGVYDSNINAILPDTPKLNDFSGDSHFRGMVCRIVRATD